MTFNEFFNEDFENSCADEFFNLPNYRKYAKGNFDLIYEAYKENYVDTDFDDEDDCLPSLEDFIDYVIC